LVKNLVVCFGKIDYLFSEGYAGNQALCINDRRCLHTKRLVLLNSQAKIATIALLACGAKVFAMCVFKIIFRIAKERIKKDLCNKKSI
jgi:hypothetical protein